MSTTTEQKKNNVINTKKGVKNHPNLNFRCHKRKINPTKSKYVPHQKLNSKIILLLAIVVGACDQYPNNVRYSSPVFTQSLSKFYISSFKVIHIPSTSTNIPIHIPIPPKPPPPPLPSNKIRNLFQSRVKPSNWIFKNKVFYNYGLSLQIKRNETMHSLTGNKQYNSLKILQINKGSSNFSTKKNDIDILLSDHSPDFLAISEANILKSDKNLHKHYPDYDILLNKTSETHDLSRNVVLIKSNIPYKRRLDLEDDITCTIWVEVKPKKTKSFLLMGGYRQWRIPQKIDKNDTRSTKHQLSRYGQILAKWQLAINENKDVLVAMDDNIDSNKDSKINKQYKLKGLIDLLQSHMAQNNISQHNHQNTHFQSNHSPSCIDHIYSNCPNKVSNVTTIPCTIADHHIISCIYKTNATIYKPRFIKSRNFKLLTRESLSQHVEQSILLNSIFQLTDADEIADILQLELNSIINSIAPSKKIQFKSNYVPYYNQEVISDLAISKQLLNTAISTNYVTDWTAFKIFRNTTQKKIKGLEKEFLEDKLNHSRDQWKFIKKYNDKATAHPPNNILHNGENHTSPRSIATFSNNFFISKIKTIMESFTPHPVAALDILRYLIPRNKNVFILPPITLQETNKMLRNIQNSNATGHDDISNKIVKKLGPKIAPHITHLINRCILTKTVPEIFKISRILPLSKPQKPEFLLSSYRPINNLPCLEKLLEHHVIHHLDIFLSSNNIINHNHHGGRKGYSTTTALTQIYNTLNVQNERNSIAATLTTDLSSAFDTIDNFLLLLKLEHYGIRGDSLTFFKSYFTGRQQYVEIEGFKSDVKLSPKSGCVQGGKLSGVLYTLYTNEIPLLHNLMFTEMFEKVTNIKPVKFKIVDHVTVCFVDDATHLIFFNNTNNIKLYLTQFYTLLHFFHNINKLKINSDKTQLVLHAKPKFLPQLSNFHFFADVHKIKAKSSIKILGTYIRSDLKNDTAIGKLAATLHNRIYNIKKLTHVTNFKNRLKFLNSYVIGKLIYACPIYMNASEQNIVKLHKVIMTAARAAIGNYCFKKSVDYILQKCNWLTAKNLILNSSLNLIHKIITNQAPPALFNLYKNIKTKRSVVAATLTYRPKTKCVKNFFLYKGTNIYNSLPNFLKNLPIDKFKKQIKVHLRENNIQDTMD